MIKQKAKVAGDMVVGVQSLSLIRRRLYTALAWRYRFLIWPSAGVAVLRYW